MPSAGEVVEDLLVGDQRVSVMSTTVARPLPRRPAPGPPAPSPAPPPVPQCPAHPSRLPPTPVAGFRLVLVLLVQAVQLVQQGGRPRQHARLFSATLAARVLAGARQVGVGSGSALRALDLVRLRGQANGQLLGAAVQLARVPQVGEAEEHQDADGRRRAGHHQSHRELLGRAGGGRHGLFFAATATTTSDRAVVTVPFTAFAVMAVVISDAGIFC